MSFTPNVLSSLPWTKNCHFLLKLRLSFVIYIYNRWNGKTISNPHHAHRSLICPLALIMNFFFLCCNSSSFPLHLLFFILFLFLLFFFLFLSLFRLLKGGRRNKIRIQRKKWANWSLTDFMAFLTHHAWFRLRFNTKSESLLASHTGVKA